MADKQSIIIDDSDFVTDQYGFRDPVDTSVPTNDPSLASSMDAFSQKAPLLSSTVKTASAAMPVVGPLIASGVDILLDDSEVAFTPYEDPRAVRDAAPVGTGPDGKVALNLQAVRSPLRLATNLLFDDTQDKANFVREQLGAGWEVAEHPNRPHNLLLKKKGAKYWGVLDPGSTTSTFDEMISEAKENTDLIAQMFLAPSGVVASALTAGGIQAVRQALKKTLLPSSDFSTGDVAVDTALGGVFGGGGNLVKRGAKEAANLTSNAAGIIKNVTTRAADSSAWQRIKDIPKVIDSPTWKAREYGATAQQFNDFQKKSIEDNIDYLQKLSPDFVAADKAYTIRGKYEGFKDLLKQTGENIGAAFNDPNKTISLKDVFESDAFRKLTEAANTRVVAKGQQKVRVNRGVQKKIQETRYDMLEQLATLVMPEGASTNNILNMFRKRTLGKSDIAKQLGTTTDTDTMVALLQGETIPMSEAWLMRMGTDELVKYGASKKAIASLSSARKMIPDALRDAMDKSITNQFGPDAANILNQTDIYHNLMPIVQTLSKKVATNKAELWNPLQTMPGTLYSAPRFALALGRNLINRPEIATAIRSGGLKFPMPEGASYMSPKTGVDMMRSAVRGGQFASMNAFADKMLLPRDTNVYFEDPEAINALTNAVGSDEATAVLLKQYERGDKEGFANTLSLLAAQREDVFDPAPYKSLVTQGGKPIITDMSDREQYRMWVDKNIQDPKEKYRILKSLNFDGEMVKPPFEPTPLPKIQRGTNASPVARVAKSLRASDKVELDDGSERVDYGY